jgi:hypothetical protein
VLVFVVPLSSPIFNSGGYSARSTSAGVAGFFAIFGVVSLFVKVGKGFCKLTLLAGSGHLLPIAVVELEDGYADFITEFSQDVFVNSFNFFDTKKKPLRDKPVRGALWITLKEFFYRVVESLEIHKIWFRLN